jgi:hypothetical protein
VKKEFSMRKRNKIEDGILEYEEQKKEDRRPRCNTCNVLESSIASKLNSEGDCVSCQEVWQGIGDSMVYEDPFYEDPMEGLEQYRYLHILGEKEDGKRQDIGEYVEIFDEY